MPDLHETINQFLEGSIASIGRDPVIESKSITANGTYTAPEGVDGYSPITVNVPTPTPVIESKSITANGTYTAPEGVDGYSPITVNVPLPQNAYLLKSVNTPTPIASFNDGEDMVMPTLKVVIEPQQDLHGYDSPWVGGAGKNKFADGTISFTWSKSYPCELGAGTYTLSALVTSTDTDATTCLFVVRDSDNQSLANGRLYRDTRSYAIFTITEQADNIIFYSADSNTHSQGDTATWTNVQVESGSTATTFAPYSNICPISGHTEANVTRCGKNLWGGEQLADDIVAKVPNATKNATNKTVTYGASSMSGIVLFNKFKSNTRYSFYFSTESSFTNVKVVYTDNTQDSPVPNTVYVSTANKTIKSLSGVYSSGNTTLKYEECGVFEGVLTASDFEPYAGTTYTIDLDGTRYGGELDVVNGIITPAPYYASYNGETLTGEWISDRDKYEVGATPTIGAQVVNIGASGTPVSILPTAVKSLRGVNNVYANTGDIKDAEYFSKEV